MRGDHGRPAAREASLLQTPIVLVLDPRAVPLVRAGATRAGGGAAEVVVSDPDLTALLDAVHRRGATCLIVGCAAPGAAIAVARAVIPRRGRALPVLGVADGRPDAPTLEVLLAPGLDALTVAVPVLDDAPRARLWDALRAERVEECHHLVEVDGRPAVEELAERVDGPSHAATGLGPPLRGVAALAAGASGVLAGRMAAAGREWRAEGS